MYVSPGPAVPLLTASSGRRWAKDGVVPITPLFDVLPRDSICTYLHDIFACADHRRVISQSSPSFVVEQNVLTLLIATELLSFHSIGRTEGSRVVDGT